MELNNILKKIYKISSTRKLRMRQFGLLIFLLLIGSVAGLSVGSPTSLAQMSGTLYKIPIDSVNVGGGEGESTAYKLFGTTGEVATGESSSGSYGLNAGFIGAQLVYLAINTASDVSMSPAIAGVSGGTGLGSTTWTVTTDNPAGYDLNIKADTTPALRSGSSEFADYTPAGANPDYNWSVAAADSEFGFTPEGVDVVQRFLDNGSNTCNTGSSNTADRCWDKFTTSDLLIARRITGNHPSGTTTTVKMQAEVGSSHIQPNGTYNATITVTALPR